MNKTKMQLPFDDRLNLNRDAGQLIHAFGEGYFIVDENGKEINTFVDEKEFKRLIEKFRYRFLLIEKFNEVHTDKFEFGEDNTLIINGKTAKYRYWNLPKGVNEMEMYFKNISDEFIA